MIVKKEHANRKVPRVPLLLPTKGVGFPFTADDYMKMRLHCMSADQFMAKYGQAPS